MSEELQQATPAQIEAARQTWQTDEIEIDDNAKAAPAGDGGTWVQAWVYISTEEQNACAQ